MRHVRVEIDPTAAMFLHYPAETATDVVTVIVLEGDVDPDVVRAALPLLQAAWPLLNVHPERVGRRWWYTTDGTPGIDLEVVEREDDEHWQRVADGIVNRPAPPGLGPLLRVVLLRGQHQPRVELLFVMHHLIADGVGPNAVIAELLSLVDRLASGDDVAAPSLHPLGPGMAALVGVSLRTTGAYGQPGTVVGPEPGARTEANDTDGAGSRRSTPTTCRPRVGPPHHQDPRAGGHRTVARDGPRAPRHDHGCALRRRRAGDRDERYAPGTPTFPMSGMVTVNVPVPRSTRARRRARRVRRRRSSCGRR